MGDSEFYKPPSAKIEEANHDPTARKLAMSALGFFASFFGVMLFFITAEMAFKSKPVDFIFETGFIITTGICSALTAALLYPLRTIPWYFHALVAPVVGLSVLMAILFTINKVMN